MEPTNMTNKKIIKMFAMFAALAVTLVLATSVGVINLGMAQEDGAGGTGGETAGEIVAEAATRTDGTNTNTDNTDASAPADVESLLATPGDSEVLLVWEAVENSAGVTGYKIYRGTHPVRSDEDLYDLPIIPVGNVTSYTVKNLSNGQTYFFAVTAVDTEGRESPNYSPEASATPQSGLHLAAVEDNGRAPEVSDVRAENKTTVIVVFSEPVMLPAESPASAFKIEKLLGAARLEVLNAVLSEDDETDATVILTTAKQEADSEYILTAGIEIHDLYDNPVISGTSDTGSFTGSAEAAPEPSESVPAPSPAPPPQPPVNIDTEPPVINEGTADFDNRIALEFSEEIVLPENPASKFSIVKKDTDEALEIINVSLSLDGKTVYITTAAQQAVEYGVTVAGITDATGNEIEESARTIAVSGKGASLEDLIPPEDVTALIARLKEAHENIVELRWEASKNSAGDLADQILYQAMGENGDKFSEGVSLGSSATAIETEDLEAGKWYTFKVTTKDTSNNESAGAITSIFLPETGPGLIAAGLTALLMGLYRKKRKIRN